VVQGIIFVIVEVMGLIGDVLYGIEVRCDVEIADGAGKTELRELVFNNGMVGLDDTFSPLVFVVEVVVEKLSVRVIIVSMLVKVILRIVSRSVNVIGGFVWGLTSLNERVDDGHFRDIEYASHCLAGGSMACQIPRPTSTTMIINSRRKNHARA